MLTIDPQETKTAQVHSYLLGAVAPRPIAFASTIDAHGNPNLSPFSFFNVFSAKPPIAVFSPARRGRDNTTKHTYENLKEVPEVVINIVDYAMVQQMSLASTEYPKGVNEFVKAGFTQLESHRIRPYRVAEAPVQLECKVREIIELGENAGAGNLVVCEVVLMHIQERVLDSNNMIDPHKIDLVARMGGDWYCRANGSALFTVPKPLTTMGIGVDALPNQIKHSTVLTGNDLGMLGNVEELPSLDEVAQYVSSGAIAEVFADYGQDLEKLEDHLHHIAHRLLQDGRVQEAWKVLLSTQKFA